MRPFVSILSLFSVTLLLSACIGKPSPLPRGYSSYEEPYKSAPGEKAADLGYAYSNGQNEAMLKDMRYAAEDLVDQLDQKLSFNVDEIYLNIPQRSAFYTSLDHVLRDELTKRGYLLSNSLEDNVVVDVVALDNIHSCYVKDTEGMYRNIFMALAIDAGQGIESDHVSGFYELPIYGFSPSSSKAVKMPDCPVTDDVEL